MLTFRELNKEFLEWSALHNAARTKTIYEGFSRQFIEYLGDAADAPAPDIKPHQVTKWIDSHHGDWGASYKNSAITTINTVYNWGITQGHITVNPIKSMKKPTPDRRENPMKPETFYSFMSHIHPQDSFRDVFLFAWVSGARPQEIRHIEARHFDASNDMISFPAIESKGKRHKRNIYLTGAALDIVKRLVALYPTGKIFRNEKGGAWTKGAIGARMARLSNTVGISHCLYDMRHSFCQRLLEAGWSVPEVMEAMGHRSPQMVNKTYSHMNKAPTHIMNKLRAIVV